MDGYNGGLARSWTQNSDFTSLGDVASLHNGPFKNQFEVRILLTAVDSLESRPARQTRRMRCSSIKTMQLSGFFFSSEDLYEVANNSFRPRQLSREAEK